MSRSRKTAASKNKRRIAKSRPSAGNQKKQIMSNQNQIIGLKKHLNLTKERIRWHCGVVGATMTTYPLIIPLTSGPSPTNPALINNLASTPLAWNVTMTPGIQNVLTSRNKVIVNKQYVDFTITAGNENQLLHYTAFVVQLNERNATQTYSDTGAMSGLVRNADFVTPVDAVGTDTAYGAYINTDKYKIIKRLEFETAGVWPIANASTSTGNTGSGTNTWYVKRCQFKINYGSTLMSTAGDGVSTGASLQYAELKPEQKRFIIVFCNNSLVDLEYPTFNISSLITGYAVE